MVAVHIPMLTKLSDQGGVQETRVCRHELHHEKAVRRFVDGWNLFVSLSIGSGSFNTSSIAPVCL